MKPLFQSIYKMLLVAAMVACCVLPTSAQISNFEYFFDTDPGWGNGTQINSGFTPGNVATLTTNIPVPSGMQPGFHQLFVRAKTAVGQWGHYQTKPFYLTTFTTGSTDINGAEYFFDTDPGLGNAAPISVSANAVVVQQVAIPTGTLQPGFHKLCIRARNNNIWGHYQVRSFYVTSVATGGNTLSGAEYFFDTDPGVGNGTSIAIVPGASVAQTLAIPINSLSTGFHRLYLRTKTAGNAWSHYQAVSFMVTAVSNADRKIAGAEYFIDADPGNGNGTPITINPAIDSVSQTFTLLMPANLSEGDHKVTIRVKNESGQWSIYQTKYFEINKPQPGSGRALAFDGSNDYLNMPTNGFTGIQTYTIEFWLKKSGVNNASHVFESNDASAPSLESNGSSGLNFWVGNSSNISTGVLNTDQWYHIACSYDKINGVQQLYLNGVQKGSVSVTANDTLGANISFMARAIAASNQRNFNGSIDEIRIWNKALTEAEVRDRMCRKITATDPLWGNLKAYYNLDEFSAVNAYNLKDSSGDVALLVNGPVRETSGAAIGNASAHSYAGSSASVNLAHLTRGDDVTATLTSGMADGLQVFVVTDTPNNTSGTTCLGSNNGYFGIFAANGTTPQFDVAYNYDGAFSNTTGSVPLSLFTREHNASAGWTDAMAVRDTVLHTLTTNSTPRAEYIVSNAVVAPTISIASTGTTICNGTPVTFTVTNVTNGGSTPHYQWQKNNSNVGTDSIQYTDLTLANGDSVICVLTSNSACVSPATAISNVVKMTVTNSLLASVTITANPGNTICDGTQVTYTATPTNGGTTPVYQWKVNNIAVGGNAPSYTSSAFQDGDVITVNMATNATCATPTTATSVADTVHVNPVVIPTIAITADAGNTICQGVPVLFTATITNGGVTPVYEWRKNGNVVGTNSNTYADANLNHGDVINCKLTSTAICPNNATVTSSPIVMTVYSTASPTISISNNTGNTICAGTAVLFTAAITNGGTTPSYRWKKNSINVGSNQATYTDSAIASNNVISCELTSSNNCASPLLIGSNEITMTVNQYLAPAITITATPGTTACQNALVTFTATATNAGAYPSYQWKKNSVSVGSNSAVYADNALQSGDEINCVVTSNYQCPLPSTDTSNAMIMTINPLPVISAGADQTILQGSSVALTATGADNYLWTTGDTTQNIIVSPTATTNYIVSTTNSNGCTNTDTVKVNVNFSNLTIAPGTYNFGNVVVNNPVTTNITITNSGTLTETVSSAIIPAPFSTTFTTQTVTAGNSITIPVTFLPTATLIYQQTMAVTTSAGNFSIILEGRGVNAAPSWTVTPAAHLFNNTQVGDSTTHGFIIHNTGNVPVNLGTIVSNNPVFTATAFINNIAVGGSANLFVKFKPTAIANYAGLITVNTATPALAPVTINLAGNGYVPGTPPVLQFATAPPYNGTSGIDKPVSPAGVFTYQIVYQQANGIAPQQGFPKVGIDLNADGDFIDAGEGLYSMSQIGTGNNWIAGETFTYATNLSLGNTYGYKFFAFDSLGNAATTVHANYISGPNVTNQALDLSIYANDITFSNNNPAVGQQFTVSAVVHNNSPFNATNVPVRFYKDSVFLTSTTLPFIAANTSETITQNLSFAPDGFYPIKVWIDSAQTLGENNPLNNYAIRPVIVGNFTLPGTINVTTTAATQSCPGPAVAISGYATYAGLNLAGTPPALGATVTVQITGGPTLTTNTVTGGYWSVYYSGFGCGNNVNYTVTVTDYTLTSAATPGTFNAPCQSCGGSVYYPVTPSGSVAAGCILENTPFNYTIDLVNSCSSDTAINDTTFVYLNNVLAYTHTLPVLLPCSTAQYIDAFTLAAGSHTLSFTNIYYDSTGRHEASQSYAVFVQQNLPDLALGNFSQTSATSFTVRDMNITCVGAGMHKVYLYDSTAGNARIVLDSFTVSSIAASGYETIIYNKPSLSMGYHYLKLVTDIHNTVNERNEGNNELNALLYVPFPELSISNIQVSNSNIGGGSVVNYSATVHNTGSTAGTFKVEFLANGVPIGAKKTVASLVGSGGSSLVVSDAYTVAVDSCPVTFTSIVDVDAEVTELNELNNADSMHLAIDLVSGIGCNGLGSSCNPYVVVKNAVHQFSTSVSNIGTRSVGEVVVKFSLNGATIGSDHITGIAAQNSASSSVYHSFSAAGSYAINVYPDSGNLVCEYNEGNNMGLIYVNVVEGMPDLELLSQHISPSNLNPNPNQPITVVASVFNKGTQTAQPTKVRVYVDNVQLGADIQLDSILAGRDTSFLATASYSSPTIGPKIIKVTTDVLNEINELRENNNEATRAIIVGGAPDLASSLHEAITFSQSNFRRNDTVTIRNYIRNYGGDQGQAWLRFTVNDSLSNIVFRDSVQFTLLSNDSIVVSKSWMVNMAGRGLVTTEILRSNPQEFNELNNTDTFSFEAGPALKPVIASAQPYLCEGDKLKIPATTINDGQPITYEWSHKGLPTGITNGDSLVIASVVLSDSGAYNLTATDFWGSRSADDKVIVVNPVLVPAVSISAYPGTEICKGSSVKFTATAINGGAAPSFQWTKNGMNVGFNSAIYRDSTLETNDVVNCTMISNAPCTSTLPVPATDLTMIVNPLSGALPPATASQTLDVDSGMRFNYTDNICRLIASVTTEPGTDLGPTTATTAINPAIVDFVSRFTEITPTNNLPAMVKLYFLQTEFDTYNSYATTNSLPLLPSSHNDPNVENIAVYQYHGLPSGGTTGPGGQYDATNFSVIPSASISKLWNSISGYWEISFPVTGFSGHFLKAENASVLPIHLADITAKNKGNINEVSWQTKTEATDDYFELERSRDGKTFTRIMSITANGTASSYKHQDENPFSGNNYYRLKMFDGNGRSKYSKVVYAFVKQAGFAIDVFPNPAKDKLNVTMEGHTATGMIQLMNVAGSVVQQLSEVNAKMTIDISHLAQGVYFLKYSDEAHSKTIRVVKE